MGLLWPTLILFLAVAIPLARPLFLGAGFLDDDIFLQSLPAWEWLGHSLRAGESLFWSPQMMGGFPIAFTQYPFLYPPDLLLAWLLSAAQAYAWSMALHLLAAGVLTYLYCRVVGLGKAPSLLAAASFQMSSEVVAGSSGFAAGSAFALPAVLLSVEMVLRRGWRWGPALSLSVAAALLGGHPQLVLAELLAGAAYTLYRLAQLGSRAGPGSSLRLAGWLALAGGIGAAGAAVRLLPTWEVVALSTRAAGLPEAAAAGGSLSLLGLLSGYLLPLTRLQTVPWGAPDYAGPVVLLLALLGLRRLVSQPHGRFYLGMALLTALLALGDATPLHFLLGLPLLSFFREPSRLTMATTFSLCMLGAISLDGLQLSSKAWWEAARGKLTLLAAFMTLVAAALFCLGAIFQYGSGPSVEGLRVWSQSHFLDPLNPLRPRMALALLGLPATLVAISVAARGRISRERLGVALVAVALAVLVPLAAILNPTIAPDVLSQVPPPVQFLQGQHGDYRIFGHRPGVRLYNHEQYYGPGPEAGFSDDLRYRFQAAMLAPALNLRWGISSADGYEQLHSRQQEVMLRFLDSERVSDWVAAPGRWAGLNMEQRFRVLSMVGVRYMLSAVDLTPQVPGLRIAGRWDVASGPASLASPPVYLLENPRVLPRYYLVANARAVEDDGAALDTVALGEVDPASTVLLADGAPDGRSMIPANPSRGAVSGRAEVITSHNDAVVVRVATDRPAYLVTSDAYWPGWRAYLDGREVPLLRANVTGRAIALVDPGVHQVEFRFEPPGFATGLLLSIGAALICVIWLGAGIVTRRR